MIKIIFLSSVIWHVDAEVTPACDAAKFEKFDGNNKCLKILPIKTDWSGAKAECEKAGFTLHVPTDTSAEDIFWDDIVRVWTGIRKSDSTHTYQDLDGKDISHVSWHDNQPDNYLNQEKCIEISNGGPAYEWFFHKQTDCKKCRIPFVPGWNDENCDTNLNPLCERPCNDADCSTDPKNECPEDGWENDGNGNCYHLSLYHKSWGEAQCECTKTGAHLAHLVDTSYEKHLRNVPAYWIGYHLDYVNETVNNQWVDTDGNNATYTNWMFETPDNWGNLREWCGEIRDFGQNSNIKEARLDSAPFAPGWNDAMCHPENRQNYICQRKISASKDPIECEVVPLWEYESNASSVFPSIISLTFLIFFIY